MLAADAHPTEKQVPAGILDGDIKPEQKQATTGETVWTFRTLPVLHGDHWCSNPTGQTTVETQGAVPAFSIFVINLQD